MGNWEKQYEQILSAQKARGEILWYAFESIKLTLAPKTTYLPDFVVLTKDLEIEFHEVKGMWEANARTKIKVAAEKFPCRFIAITKDKGEWVYEEI